MNQQRCRLKNIYIFIGPPGSGKGTLSNLCVTQFGWDTLSTGNLCRKHIIEQTEIGKQIDFALKSGKLVSDSLIACLVEDWFEQISNKADAVILDGYPRTVVQAETLQAYLKNNFSWITIKIVKFSVEDEVVASRLGNRYICANKDCQAVYSLAEGSRLVPKRDGICDYCSSPLGKRADDDSKAIQERLVVYHKHEGDMISFYMTHGYKPVEFNVDKNLDAVFAEFKQLACLNSI